MNFEIWKDIKDYEGKYQISSWGRVKSLSRKIEYIHPIAGSSSYHFPERINKPYMSVGYWKVDLSDKPRKKRRAFIHKLIAEAFIPNPFK